MKKTAAAMGFMGDRKFGICLNLHRLPIKPHGLIRSPSVAAAVTVHPDRGKSADRRQLLTKRGKVFRHSLARRENLGNESKLMFFQ